MYSVEDGIRKLNELDYIAAIKIFGEIIDKKIYKDDNEYYELLMYMGQSYKALSNYIQSIKYYRLSLKIAIKLNDKYKEFDSIYSCISVYCLVQDFKSAETDVKIAVDLAKTINNNKYIAKAYNLQGAIYLDSASKGDNHKLEEGILKLKKGLEFANGDNLLREHVILICNIGEANYKLERYEEAKRYLYEALSLYKDEKENEVLGFIYLNIAKCDVKLSHYKEAQKNCNMSIDYFRREKNSFSIAHSYVVMSDIYRRQGEIERALECYMNYSELIIDIKNKEYSKIISMMQEEYKTLEIEKDNEIYRLKNEELAEANKRLKDAYEEVARLSMMDYLTGVYNRRGLFQIIKDICDKDRNGIILLDIDFFKDINDQYGHNAGDIVLQEIVRRIDIIKEKNYVVTRWGGEEFLIILPGKDKNESFDFAELLSKSVTEKPFNICGKEINVSFTAGIDEFLYNADFDKVVKNVDLKLYIGKRAGRGVNIR